MVSELRRGSESNGGGMSTHMHVVCMEWVQCGRAWPCQEGKRWV